MSKILAILIWFLVAAQALAQGTNAPSGYASLLYGIQSRFDPDEDRFPKTYGELVSLTRQLEGMIRNLKKDSAFPPDARIELLDQAGKLLARMREKRVTGKLDWNLMLNGGFSLTGGNSDLLNLNGGLKASRKLMWIDELTLDAEFDYRLDQLQVTYQVLGAELRYGHSLTRSLYLFVQGNYISDLAASMDNGIQFHGGPGYWIFDRTDPKLQLGIELGSGWYKVFYTGGMNEDRFILSGQLWFCWDITGSVTFKQDLDFYPSPYKVPLFLFIMNSKTSLEFKIGGGFSLAFDLNIGYNSEPRPGVKKLDYSQTAKILLKL